MVFFQSIAVSIGLCTGPNQLFVPFLEYHLNRLNLLSQIYELVLTNKTNLDNSKGLPDDVRTDILSKYEQMYDWLNKYGQVLKNAPGDMLHNTYNTFKPTNIYNEWMAGYDSYLDNHLEIRQFVGTMNIQHSKLSASSEFTLNIELHNNGVLPWITGVGQAIVLDDNAKEIGLPLRWDFTGEPMAPGDRRTIKLNGKTPAAPGEAKLKISFTNPYRGSPAFIEKEITMVWN